jgi:hypothetical protein
MAQRRTVQTTSDGLPLIKAMVYGFGGTGKTTLAFTFNQDKRTAPTLVLNASGNPDWLMRRDPTAVVIDLEKYEDIDLPFSFLLQGQPETHKFRKDYDIPGDVVFKTLVVDTFSDWQVRMIENVTGQLGQTLLSDARGPTLKERGPILSKTIKPARELLTTLSLHVVLLLQERTKINIEGGTESSIPWIDGGARELIPSWANFVGHMTNQNVDKNIVPVLTWKSASLVAYTKNQWVPDINERGMAAPTASKLFDLAAKYIK